MTDILAIFGTRPEAIKLGPVAHELLVASVDIKAICTGQHTSLLAGSPAETTFADAVSLGMASDGNVTGWTARIREKLTLAIRDVAPEIVIVQGDTMSAVVGASVAYDLEIPIGHIEAGVRSHDDGDPWPEERNRKRIAELATWHYAPTTTAMANLMAESVPEARIRVTGNTVVSALARYAPDTRFVPQPENVILVTLHRRELHKRDLLNNLYGTIRLQALSHPHLTFVWPVHPAIEKLLDRLHEPPNLKLRAPMAYTAFTQRLAHSKGLLTDSGGAVEEAATLGVPTVILRATNDRPEAVEAGIAIRADVSPEGIISGVQWLTDPQTMRLPTSAFGDETAADQVATHLAWTAMRMKVRA